jgi:hypothetical protein
MDNLKQNLAELAKEFCNKEIPDFNELFHDDPTTDDLERLICIESVVEQQEICPYSKFNTEELKQAARTLDEFYFCLEETLNRFIYFVNKNQKSENLIKVLIWKKNIAAIRRYFANNIVSELNQMCWDLTPYMINTLFKRESFYTLNN